MFLTAPQIEDMVKSEKLKIEPFSTVQLKPVSYTFRLENHTVIKPQEVLNLTSLESIEFPDYIGGLLSTRGSIARLGLDCLLTDIVIEPGSKGKLNFSTVNHSNHPVTLEAGTPIVKCLFFTVSD